MKSKFCWLVTLISLFIVLWLAGSLWYKLLRLLLVGSYRTREFRQAHTDLLFKLTHLLLSRFCLCLKFYSAQFFFCFQLINHPLKALLLLHKVTDLLGHVQYLCFVFTCISISSLDFTGQFCRFILVLRLQIGYLSFQTSKILFVLLRLLLTCC